MITWPKQGQSTILPMSLGVYKGHFPSWVLRGNVQNLGNFGGNITPHESKNRSLSTLRKQSRSSTDEDLALDSQVSHRAPSPSSIPDLGCLEISQYLSNKFSFLLKLKLSFYNLLIRECWQIKLYIPSYNRMNRSLGQYRLCIPRDWPTKMKTLTGCNSQFRIHSESGTQKHSIISHSWLFVLVLPQCLLIPIFCPSPSPTNSSFKMPFISMLPYPFIL